VNFLAIAGRALGFRPPPKSPSPVWPATTSATSAGTKISVPTRPKTGRSFAQIIAQSRPAAPARPVAVVGAAAGEFGTPVRRPPAPARPAASRPAPSPWKPRDFSHLDGNTVQPVDEPRLPAQPNPRYSAMWQAAFKLVLTGERPAATKGDPAISKLWSRAFAKALGDSRR
jgi:hypothetical protein